MGGKVERVQSRELCGLGKLFITKAPDVSAVLGRTAVRLSSTSAGIRETEYLSTGGQRVAESLCRYNGNRFHNPKLSVSLMADRLCTHCEPFSMW